MGTDTSSRSNDDFCQNCTRTNYTITQNFLQELSFVTLSDSLDWKDLAAGEIIQRVTSKVQPGSIVLFHNAALHTPEALPTIIQTLLQEGYTFVPISQILLSGEYTIDVLPHRPAVPQGLRQACAPYNFYLKAGRFHGKIGQLQKIYVFGARL